MKLFGLLQNSNDEILAISGYHEVGIAKKKTPGYGERERNMIEGGFVVVVFSCGKEMG